LEQWPSLPIFGDAFRPFLVDTRNGSTISAGTTFHTTTKRPEFHV
jgi:ferric-dicitrate binding protein FerR (iron transport regulator)